MTTPGGFRGRDTKAWLPYALRFFAALISLYCAPCVLFALAPGLTAPRTTFVVFSDRPMTESAWASLFAELRREAASVAHTISALDDDPQLLKGLDVVPGQLIDNPIVVKLRGDCQAPARVRPFPSGAPLGWVRREEGHISPFVQVDCTRVAQLISQRISWMDDRQKSAAMSGAIARVILHEWIHIAQQSDSHARKGIAKARFGIDDLLSGFYAELSSSEASQRAGKPAAKIQPE